MSKNNVILIFLAVILPVLLTCGSSVAFQTEVIPAEVNPGNAFLIKVTGISVLPDALLNDRHFYFSSCGEKCFHAIGGMDVDTKPGVYYIHLNVGGKKKKLNLTVKSTVFPTIDVTLPDEKVFLSPQDQKRADEDAEKLESIWKMISDKLWNGNFIKPIENVVSTEFGVTRIINKKKVSIHRGVDIKGETGEEVKASNRGRVVLAEELFFGGNTIVLDHGQGIYTIYMHLSKFHVKLKDSVSKGDVIGFVGSSGRVNGPHLHFGIKVQDIATNPLSFLELRL